MRKEIKLIGAPCPTCGINIDQPRDIEGNLMFSYFGIPANWCHACEAWGIETHLLWSDGKWIERQI